MDSLPVFVFAGPLHRERDNRKQVTMGKGRYPNLNGLPKAEVRVPKSGENKEMHVRGG